MASPSKTPTTSRFYAVPTPRTSNLNSSVEGASFNLHRAQPHHQPPADPPPKLWPPPEPSRLATTAAAAGSSNSNAFLPADTLQGRANDELEDTGIALSPLPTVDSPGDLAGIRRQVHDGALVGSSFTDRELDFTKHQQVPHVATSLNSRSRAGQHPLLVGGADAAAAVSPSISFPPVTNIVNLSAGGGHARSGVGVVPTAAGGSLICLPDVEVSQSQFAALTLAADQVMKINEGVVGAVNRLNRAAIQLSRDTSDLDERQKRETGRVNTVWNVAAEVREEVSLMRTSLDRYTRATDEINHFLQLEARRHETMLQALLKRTRRNELLLRRQTVEEAQRLCQESTRRRFFVLWRRHASTRLCARNLLQKTTFGQRVLVWRKWTNFLCTIQRQRTWFRALEHMEIKSAKIIAKLRFQAWLRYVKFRRQRKQVCGRLLWNSTKHRQKHFFQKWLRFASNKQLVKRQLLNAMQNCRGIQKASIQLLGRTYFSKWNRFRLKRKTRRYLRDKSLYLLKHVTVDYARKLFAKWKYCAAERKAKRDCITTLEKKNLFVILRKAFGDWRRLHWQRWVTGEVRRHCDPVSQKVDIGLKTTANTNETIQKLIEQLKLLEERLEELRLSKISYHDWSLSNYFNAVSNVNNALAQSQPPNNQEQGGSIIGSTTHAAGGGGGGMAPHIGGSLPFYTEEPSLLDPVLAMQRRHMDIVTGRTNSQAMAAVDARSPGGVDNAQWFADLTQMQQNARGLPSASPSMDRAQVFSDLSQLEERLGRGGGSNAVRAGSLASVHHPDHPFSTVTSHHGGTTSRSTTFPVRQPAYVPFYDTPAAQRETSAFATAK